MSNLPQLLGYFEEWKADLGLVVGSNNFKSLTEHLRELHREQIFHFEPDYEDYSTDGFFFGIGAGYRSQSEYILVFSKGLPNIFNLRNIGNVIKSKRANNGFHPHEKPLELIKIFISNSTKENDLVLDCFLGCGTTAVGCKELNRRYIGFEINKDFCDIANKRLEQNSLTKMEVARHSSQA
jgi:hypothetical protein